MRRSKNSIKPKASQLTDDQNGFNENELNEPGDVGFKSGDDQIEQEIGEGEKIVYGSSFSYADGDEGDESEDTDDLPPSMKRVGNRYDNTIPTGKVEEPGLDEIKSHIRETDENFIGMAYGKDKYVEEDENDKSDKQKTRKRK